MHLRDDMSHRAYIEYAKGGQVQIYLPDKKTQVICQHAKNDTLTYIKGEITHSSRVQNAVSVYAATHVAWWRRCRGR